MSGATTELLRNLARVQAVFPPGFPFASEALSAGVESLRLRRGIFGIASCYDPETGQIDLDPEADWGKIALQVGRRHGLKLTPEDARAFAFLHECGHARRRKQVLGMPRRNLLGIGGSELSLSFFLADHIAIGNEEHEAESFAKKRFLEWKRGRP